jgi:hypothetical protein
MCRQTSPNRVTSELPVTPPLWRTPDYAESSMKLLHLGPGWRTETIKPIRHGREAMISPSGRPTGSSSGRSRPPFVLGGVVFARISSFDGESNCRSRSHLLNLAIAYICMERMSARCPLAHCVLGMRRDRDPAGLPEAVAADWRSMKVFISPLSLAHHSGYAEPFTAPPITRLSLRRNSA